MTHESESPWAITDEVRELIQEVNKQNKEIKLERLNESRQWGLDLGGELVGFCGQLTGSGAITFPVFQQEDGRHFIIVGDGAGDETKFIGNEKSEVCNIKFVDPNNVFGRKMQTITEWLK